MRIERLRGRTGGRKYNDFGSWNQILVNPVPFTMLWSILDLEKLTPVPMELIFVRTKTLDLKKLAKQTRIHGAEDDSRALEWSECN